MTCNTVTLGYSILSLCYLLRKSSPLGILRFLASQPGQMLPSASLPAWHSELGHSSHLFWLLPTHGLQSPAVFSLAAAAFLAAFANHTAGLPCPSPHPTTDTSKAPPHLCSLNSHSFQPPPRPGSLFPWREELPPRAGHTQRPCQACTHNPLPHLHNL